MRAALAALAAGVACAAVAAAPAPQLPPLRNGWPATLQLGAADGPGGAAALRRASAYDRRGAPALPG